MSGGPGCSGHGDHAVAEELHDRDRVIARGARAADADVAHEAPAVFADLVADGSGSAAVAVIDGDRPAGLGLRHGKGGLGCVATSSVRGGPAGVAAVPPAAGGLERLAASGTSHRDTTGACRPVDARRDDLGMMGWLWPAGPLSGRRSGGGAVRLRSGHDASPGRLGRLVGSGAAGRSLPGMWGFWRRR